MQMLIVRAILPHAFWPVALHCVTKTKVHVARCRYSSLSSLLRDCSASSARVIRMHTAAIMQSLPIMQYHHPNTQYPTSKDTSRQSGSNRCQVRCDSVREAGKTHLAAARSSMSCCSAASALHARSASARMRASSTGPGGCTSACIPWRRAACAPRLLRAASVGQ